MEVSVVCPRCRLPWILQGSFLVRSATPHGDEVVLGETSAHSPPQGTMASIFAGPVRTLGEEAAWWAAGKPSSWQAPSEIGASNAPVEPLWLSQPDELPAGEIDRGLAAETFQLSPTQAFPCKDRSDCADEEVSMDSFSLDEVEAAPGHHNTPTQHHEADYGVDWAAARRGDPDDPVEQWEDDEVEHDSAGISPPKRRRI